MNAALNVESTLWTIRTKSKVMLRIKRGSVDRRIRRAKS